MTSTEPSLLQQAINYLQQGDRKKARELILKELRSNPGNLNAWLWALEVAANAEEKRSILKKILKLDPTHQGALQYLSKLDQIAPYPEAPEDPIPDVLIGDNNHKKRKKGRPSAIIRLFVDWAGSLPASYWIFSLFLVIMAGIFIYFRINTSLLGFAGADFDELVISNSYELISAEDIHWKVQFEGIGDSKFIGIVRHVSPIRIHEFRILTHDILVTTADFADPGLVETNVIDHKFFWKSTELTSPNGSINLIHAVPANKEIYQALLNIQAWDTVKLTGREIYTVDAYRADDTFLGTWTDTGCNTMLIETVSIIKNPDR